MFLLALLLITCFIFTLHLFSFLNVYISLWFVIDEYLLCFMHLSLGCSYVVLLVRGIARNFFWGGIKVFGGLSVE